MGIPVACGHQFGTMHKLPSFTNDLRTRSRCNGWIEYDDSCATQIDESQVVDGSAYCLFYTRVDSAALHMAREGIERPVAKEDERPQRLEMAIEHEFPPKSPT